MEQDDHCRICLEVKQDVFSIFSYQDSEYLPRVIYQISGVKISPHLEPGAQICAECAAAMVAAQTLILRCQEADEYKTRNRWRRRRKDSTNTEEVKEEKEDEEEEEEEEKMIKHEEEKEEEQKNQQQVAESAPNLDLTYEDEEALDDWSTQQYDKTPNYEEYESSEATSMPTAEPSESSQPAVAAVTADAAAVATQRRRSRVDPIKTPRFDCDRCDFQSKIGKALVEHMRNVHHIDDPLIYACTLCSERFAWKPTLYRHIQRDHPQHHPAEKRYACELCAKAYTRQVHLTEHMQQAHEPRRFKCADPDCEQTFTRAFTLRRHFQAAHTATQRYHCGECDKYFKIYDLWKYHNKVVHGNATVYCPRCGYPFRFKEKLEEHLQREACKRSIIPCQYCQRRFTAKNGLREHLKNIHNMA